MKSGAQQGTWKIKEKQRPYIFLEKKMHMMDQLFAVVAWAWLARRWRAAISPTALPGSVISKFSLSVFTYSMSSGQSVHSHLTQERATEYY